MKMELLYAGDGGTVFLCGAKGPGFQGTDHAGLDAIPQGVQHRKVGDFALRTDCDIHNHIPLHAMG